MSIKAQRINYYKEDDLLYISFRAGKKPVASESLPGIYWRYEEDTNELVGITILDFDDYWRSHLDDLVNELNSRLNIGKNNVRYMLERRLNR